MRLNYSTVRIGLLIVALGLPFAGCGKAKESVAQKAVEKAMETAASKDGTKVELDKNKMTVTTKDGGSTTLTASEKGDALTMKTADGTVTMTSGDNAKVPDDFPKDIPLYPGAKPNSASSSSKDKAFTLQFTTKDPVDKVGEHFKKEIIAQGWTEGMVMSTPGEQATMMLNYTKGDRSLMVTVAKDADNTSILLTTASK
jgi:hypothetical protein